MLNFGLNITLTKKSVIEVNSDTQPDLDAVYTFNQFGLSEGLISSLNSQGFENATPVQARTIPEIIEGRDVFALAETGSGKTGSFAIPILELIVRSDSGSQFLVLSPTRELAQQTHKVFSDFGESLDITSACLIGGENIDKQKSELETNPKVIVGTPGRVVDLIKQKCLNLKDCNGVVFDEADRLFDMGFQKDIEFILRGAPSSRQLIMVSATTNMEVLSTAYKYHSQPVEIKLNEDDLLVDSINHEVAMISKEEKMSYLVNLLRKNEDAYAIIFCNTQFMTHLVAAWLEKMGFKVKPISGRMAQNKRTRLMSEFREKKITILACTDVAARGLDIKDINLVVNYDLPNEAANYVHRIGRTGRAGKEGKAISFCAYEDCENLDAISELIETKIPKSDIEDSDFATDLCPKPYIDAKTLKEVERNKPKAKSANNKKKDERRDKKKVDTKGSSKKENIKKESKPVIERTFKYTTTNLNAAKKAALKHFRIDDELLLDTNVLSVGKKKFILFGSRETTYEFKVKAIYKRLLLPFYITLFKKMGLKIFVKIAYREPNVRISFSGKDAGLLVKNKFELQNSIEQITRIYLGKRIAIPSDTKVSFRTDRESKHQLSDEDLIKMVEDSFKKMLDSGEDSIKLKSLNPAHRRIVHQRVSEDSQFESNSIGEGRFKQIEITRI